MSLITNLEDQNPLLSDAVDVKFWMKMDETDAGLVLTDSAGDVVFPATITPDGTGSILIADQANPTAVTSGTVPSLTTDDWALFLVLNSAALTSFTIGQFASNHTIRVSTGTSVVITGAGGTATLSAANDFPATGAIEKLLVTSEQGANTTCYSGASGAALAAGTPQAESTHGDLTTIDNYLQFADFLSSGNTVYGVMLLSFSNGLPADIVAMADWTMEQWIDNNKKFYPRMTEL